MNRVTSWLTWLAPFVAVAALVLATLANFLAHNEYPFARPEVGVLASGAVIGALGFTLLYAGQRQWGRSFLEGLLASLFVDLNLTFSWSYLVAIAVGLGVAAYTYFRESSLLRPMAVIGTVILISSVLGLNGSSEWIRYSPAKPTSSIEQRPGRALLHIILDEHIGIEGIPGADPEATALKKELTSFYLSNGFTLYGRAYSEHFHTVTAIPHVLNYGRHLGRAANKTGVDVGPTVHFDTLSRQGYRLKILQFTFANLCTATPNATCTTYEATSPVPTLGVPLSTSERALLLLGKIYGLSGLAKQWAPGRWTLPLREAGRSGSVAGLAAFDHLTKELSNAQVGDAYIAHIFAPHYPYTVRADCSYLPWREWKSRRSRVDLRVRQRAYFAQVRCTTAKLRQALNAFKSSPGGANGIVIIHGDHGSRITDRDPTDEESRYLSKADMIAGFSTLFALQTPGVASQYIREPESIARLLGEFSASGFRQQPVPRTGAKHEVTLDDRDWKPKRRHDLPKAW